MRIPLAMLLTLAALHAGCSEEDGGARCAEPFRLALPAATADGLALDGDRVLVAGAADDAGWVGAVDRCAGSLGVERSVGDGATLSAVTASTGAVYVAGSGSGDALVARLEPASLEERWSAALGEPGEGETVFDLVRPDTGRLWVAGEVSAAGVAARARLMRVDEEGVACQVPLPAAGVARALAAQGSSVWVASVDRAELRLHRYDDAACAAGGCDCDAAASVGPETLEGAASIDVRAVAVSAGEAAVAGLFRTGDGDTAGFVARVDLASGESAWWRWNPTARVDGFLDVDWSGDAIYAGGGRGWDGTPGFATSTASVVVLDAGFDASTEALREIRPAGLRLVSALAVDGAVYASGLGGAGAVLVACSLEGECPGSGGGADGGVGGDGGVDDAGAVDAATPDGGTMPDAVPRIHPDDPHRLMRRGETWLPAGYYPGAALNMTGEDWAGDFRAYNEALIDTLADQGIDLFRVWINWGAVTNFDAAREDQWDRHILTPWMRTGPGTAADGEPRLDLDRLNEAYLAEIEHAVRYAAERDVVVQPILLDCWHATFGRRFGFTDLDFFAAGNNVNGETNPSAAAWIDPSGPIFARNEAFVRAVVRRIGDAENLIWETCNEPEPIDPTDPVAVAMHPFHAAVAAAIHDEEARNGHPRHLVMPVDLPEHRTVAGHRTPTNGGGMEQSVADMHRELADEQYAWDRVLVSDNDCCPGEPDAALVRRKAWAALTAGAQVDVFNNEMYRREVLEGTTARQGMRWVGHTQRFVEMLGVELAGMRPRDDLVGSGAWALAREGDAIVVYLHGTGSVTPGGLPADREAWWFDPRAGTATEAGAGPTFDAPGAGDWVLYARRRP